MVQASDGIEALRRNVDTLIVIPNDRSATGLSSHDSPACATSRSLSDNNEWKQGSQRSKWHLLQCRLLDVVGESTPLQDAFLLADDVLRQVLPSEQSHPQVDSAIAFGMGKSKRKRAAHLGSGF
jgi:cell division protein FtsZ